MTASIRNQITARVYAVLAASPPSGATIFRSREIALARAVTPAIIVYPMAEETEAFGDLFDQSGFTLAVEIVIRGEVWDDLADPLAVGAHALIMNDATLLGLCARIRRTGATWEGKEADATAGVLAQTYRFTYASPAGSL